MDCPVCKLVGDEQLFLSQGVVLSALQAYVNRDDQTMLAIHQTATAIDFHAAVGILMSALLTLNMVIGTDIEQFIRTNRELLNAEIASLGGENPDSSGPDGPNQPVNT